MGVRWSFTPVIDVNAAFRSPIVGTRSYGSDVDKIERHAVAHVRGLQRNGVAATAKHWPGEGYDDRDQHLVTTTNPLSMEEWKEILRSALQDADQRGRAGGHERAYFASCLYPVEDAGCRARSLPAGLGLQIAER